MPPEFDGYVIPHLVVVDVPAAISFYEKAFDAVESSRATMPDGRVLNAQLFIGPQPLWLMEDMPEANNGQGRAPIALADTPCALHRFVPDVDAVVTTAVAAGATVRSPTADMPWGHRYAAVVDPFGHEWSFASVIEHVDEAEMARRLGG